MKKQVHLSIWVLALSMIFSVGVLAQEKTEVSVQVKKDGKIVKDTTYQFEDASEAKHALKMMELFSGEELHKAHLEGDHSKAMVFISEDGEKTELKEFDGQHVVVMKSEDGSTVDILLDEDEEGNIVKKKEIKVRVSDDENASWTVLESDDIILDEEEDVYVIQGDDDVKTEIIKIMKEYDGEDDSNVKVIVVKKKQKKENK